MTDLGELGAAREAPSEMPAVTFGYFGKVIRLTPDMSDLVMVDIVETTLAAENMDGIHALAAVKSLLRTMIHPEDFPVMWAAARANGQGVDDIAELSQRLVTAVTDRPTKRPSDSSDGPSETPLSSEDASSLRIQRSFEAQGRPDLAVFPYLVRLDRSA